MNEFYRSKDLFNQAALLLPKADVTTDFASVTDELISLLDTLEPLRPDEHGMDVDPALPVDRMAALVLARLDLAG